LTNIGLAKRGKISLLDDQFIPTRPGGVVIVHDDDSAVPSEVDIAFAGIRILGETQFQGGESVLRGVIGGAAVSNDLRGEQIRGNGQQGAHSRYQGGKLHGII
jgi:hypothetical protein